MAEVDYKRKLINYLKKNLKKGYTEDSLRWALVNQGYSRTSVEDAIEKSHQELSEKAPILKEKPKIKYEIIDEYDKPVAIKKPWWKFW
jgi:hypothetical protein